MTEVDVRAMLERAMRYEASVVEGRFMNQTDMDSGSHVAIIGADIEENLMKGVDPIGKEIRVDGQSYTVVGLGNSSLDDVLTLQSRHHGDPTNTGLKRFPTDLNRRDSQRLIDERVFVH